MSLGRMFPALRRALAELSRVHIERRSCSNAHGAEAAASLASSDEDPDAERHRHVASTGVRVLVSVGGPQAAPAWRTVAVSGSVLMPSFSPTVMRWSGLSEDCPSAENP